MHGWRFDLLCLLALLPLVSCGGSGGSVVQAFAIRTTTPANGVGNAVTDSALFVSFSAPADAASLVAANFALQRASGTPVPFTIQFDAFNTTTVRVNPVQALDENAHYHLIVDGAVRGADGSPLGADTTICFVTASQFPTLRPDQIVDLGDALNTPRYQAQWIRMLDGRTLVIGGFDSETTATNRIEIWDPLARRFEYAAVSLIEPRAQFTASLLRDGRILIAGGVSAPGGPALRTTEFIAPGASAIGQGPDLIRARRVHAASEFLFDQLMVSGGIGAAGTPLTSIEVWEDGVGWRLAGDLPEPTAQHFQFTFGLDEVFFNGSNDSARGAFWSGEDLLPRTEGDIRYQATFASVGANRILVVGGQTRSAIVFDRVSRFSWGATRFLREARAAHSMTRRSGASNRFIVAGGFDARAAGQPALGTVEIVDYMPAGPFGTPDAIFYPVRTVVLPAVFAGHSGFNQVDGSTVLAGGIGAGTGPHSRRVVLLLDDAATPAVACR